MSLAPRYCATFMAGRLLGNVTVRAAFRPATTRPVTKAGAHLTRVETRAWLHSSLIRHNVAAHVKQVEGSDVEHSESGAGGLVTTFEELGSRQMVAQTVVNRLTSRPWNLDKMTPVQVQTINPCLEGHDLIAQAKTGTGKTLGFLIPVVQRIINADPKLATQSLKRGRMSPDIRAIVISPTRELAEQIAVEAKKLTSDTRLKVQTAVGGTQKNLHLQTLHREGCHILVGTPGRLTDILSDPRSGIDVSGLDALVLDEADRLLDDGFAPDLERIHDELLPDKAHKDRQTLMFSATMPREVMAMVRRFMKQDFRFVRTVQENEAPTHQKVPQTIVRTAGLQNVFPALLELMTREVKASEEEGKFFKPLIFFNTNAEVSMYYDMFRNLSGLNSSTFSSDPFAKHVMVEMHSRLTQAARTRNSGKFRSANSAIMFSSDVSARGMDFPNVTHVIQVGVPRDRETYIHRLGRTGRGDKTGEGWLISSPLDSSDARFRLRGLPIRPDNSLSTAVVDMTKDGQMEAGNASLLSQIAQAAKNTPYQKKADTYRAALGVYNSAPKQEVVDQLGLLAKFCWGMEVPPAVGQHLVHKLGYSRTRGINTDQDQDQYDERPETRFQGFRLGSNSRNRQRPFERSNFRDRSQDRGNSERGASGRSGYGRRFNFDRETGPQDGFRRSQGSRRDFGSEWQ